MKHLMFLFLTLIITQPQLWAQGKEHEKEGDRIQSVKIAFITEKLNLSSKEASAFWPVYNEYDEQVKKLREKQRESAKAFLDKSAPSDTESEKFIAEQLANRQAESDLLKKYAGEFKKVLPVSKAARLLTLEMAFKQQMLRHMQQRQHPQGEHPNPR